MEIKRKNCNNRNKIKQFKIYNVVEMTKDILFIKIILKTWIKN